MYTIKHLHTIFTALLY